MAKAEEVALDIETWCRLCLKEHHDAYTIFAQDDTQLSIPMRLMACLALEVKPTDGLPKKICADCRYQLEKSFLFRQCSQMADKKLRKHNRLISMGKKSRVFAKPLDSESDEDDLEFEESLEFIRNEEKIREKSSQAWQQNYMQKQEEEFKKRLDSMRLKLCKEVRKELMEEVRSEVRQEIHDEVQEENRKEQLAKLLGEIEVFLSERKAGLWQPMTELPVEAKSLAQPDPAPAVVPAKLPTQHRGNRKRGRNSPPIVAKKREKSLDTQDVEYILGGDGKAETISADEGDQDSSLPETMESFRDIKMVGAGDVVATQSGEIYIINSATASSATPASSTECQPDDITSYQIRDNGEIQFTDSKSDDMGDVVVFNLNSDVCEDQQLYEFKEKFIILSNEKSENDCLMSVKDKKNDFVVKRSSRNVQPTAGRVTDTLKTFQCQLCPIAFATEKMLSRHLNIHIKTLKAGNGGALKCPVCELQLSCASSLKRHMIIHTGVKPYKCDECDLAFSQREVLKRHMDTHTGEKRHKCPHCDTSFAQKTNLQQHISRMHTKGDRQHRCHLCQRSFHHVSGLSRHLVTHAGVSFACNECGRQFNDRSAVQRHVQNVHKLKDTGNDSVDDIHENIII